VGFQVYDRKKHD
jgi:hypothetical protein